MARFYGTVCGGRGEASRLGTPKSGLTAYAASWSGGVRVHMYAIGDTDCVRITAVDHGQGRDQPMGPLFDGPVAHLKEMISVWEHIEDFRAYMVLKGRSL